MCILRARRCSLRTSGQEQDEVQTEFTQVPKGTTLEQAAEMSKTLK